MRLTSLTRPANLQLCMLFFYFFFRCSSTSTSAHQHTVLCSGFFRTMGRIVTLVQCLLKGPACRIQRDLFAVIECDIHNDFIISVLSPETKNPCVSVTLEGAFYIFIVSWSSSTGAQSRQTLYFEFFSYSPEKGTMRRGATCRSTPLNPTHWTFFIKSKRVMLFLSSLSCCG